jgi:serine/threonine-protein kinase
LPKKTAKSGTITGWIFGGARCKCFSSDTTAGAPSADAAALKTGLAQKNLNELYEQLGLIGTGGMGRVYRVRERSGQAGRLLALKLLRAELANDPVAVKRFQLEILAAKELLHPNLVRIFDCGISHEGNPYFVMELIEGESLATVLQRQGTIAPERAAAVFVQVCAALSHAHEHNIIHRDLKPSNILLTRSADGGEVAKLVDFGVAKILPAPGKDTFTITKTGEIFGSPTYMSPEQCQGEIVDARSDIYALGCVMYESLTGHPPIYSENPVKTLLGHIYDRPAPMHIPEIDTRMAQKLDAIVGTCLEKQPDCRYDSVKALSDDLQTVTTEREPRALKDARAKEKSETLKRNIKTNSVMALPAVLIAMVVFALWYTGSDLMQMSKFVDAVEKEPKDYFNPKLAQQCGIDPYDIPNCYEFIAEDAVSAKHLPKASDIFLAESKIFVGRGDKTSAVAPAVSYECCEAYQGHRSTARAAAFDAANLLLESTRQIPKGMRFGRWFYIMLYPSKLEMYKIPQILDQQRDYKTAEQLCGLLSQSVFNPSNNYPSLVTEGSITDTIHYFYLGNPTLGNRFYKMTMDHVGRLPDDPMGPINRFIADKIGLANDIVVMYFGDRRCPPELFNRYFGNCAIAAGDWRTAHIIFSNIDKAYRALGLAATATLSGEHNTDALWDAAINDRLTTVDWPEDELVDTLYLNQKLADLDVIYPPMISAAKRRGQPAVMILINMEAHYFSILCGQQKQTQAALIRHDLMQITDRLPYSVPLHTALRTVADHQAETSDLSGALASYRLLLRRDSADTAGQQFIAFDKLSIACIEVLQKDYSKADTIYGELLASSRDQTVRNCVWIAKANEDMARGNIAQSTQDVSNLAIVNPNTWTLTSASFSLTPWIDCNLYIWDRSAEILMAANKLTGTQKFLSDSLAFCNQANLSMQIYHCNLASAFSQHLANSIDAARYANQSHSLGSQLSNRQLLEISDADREWQIYTGALKPRTHQ